MRSSVYEMCRVRAAHRVEFRVSFWMICARQAPHVTRPMALSQTLSLDQNKIGDTGAIALADALKATFAMCFSSGARSMFFWQSLTQCPDYNHLSPWEQTRSTLMWRSVGVLFCVHRVRCGVRCGSSSLHHAFANMHSQVSCMDVLRAILVYAAIIQRRGAFLVHTEQGISHVALTVNTCLLACLQQTATTRHRDTGRIAQDTT